MTYYIAGITKEADGSGYSVYFPDVPTVCAGGSDMAEAIEHATDGLAMALKGIVEDNQAIPEPSILDKVKAGVREFRKKVDLPVLEDETIYQFIPAPCLEAVPVRVNVSIPKNILQQIDTNAKLAGMSRSGYLCAAVMAYAR